MLTWTRHTRVSQHDTRHFSSRWQCTCVIIARPGHSARSPAHLLGSYRIPRLVQAHPDFTRPVHVADEQASTALGVAPSHAPSNTAERAPRRASITPDVARFRVSGYHASDTGRRLPTTHRSPCAEMWRTRRHPSLPLRRTSYA